jgi:hypothetical protein
VTTQQPAAGFFAHRRRWLIVALLFCFSVASNFDRQTLSVHGPERQPDGRRLIANRPSSAAVKCTYGPRIRATFDKWYGLVHNTEQPAAAIRSCARDVAW